MPVLTDIKFITWELKYKNGQTCLLNGLIAFASHMLEIFIIKNKFA